MENTYHFELLLFDGQTEFCSVLSPVYKAAIEYIYQHKPHVVGTQLKALKLWGGLTLIKAADLFNPSSYDVDF